MVIWITADRSTEADSTASNRASLPEATRDAESAFFPWALTNRPRITLTTTATAMRTRDSTEYSAASGVMIFLTDSTRAVMPA